MSKEDKLGFNWVLTSKKLPGHEDHNIPTTELNDYSESDVGVYEVIDFGHDQYVLTKVDKFKSMQGVPFDEDVIFVAFLQGDEKGERFRNCSAGYMAIAEVEVTLDEVTLYFANNSMHKCAADAVGYTIRPSCFREKYLSDD